MAKPTRPPKQKQRPLEIAYDYPRFSSPVPPGLGGLSATVSTYDLLVFLSDFPTGVERFFVDWFLGFPPQFPASRVRRFFTNKQDSSSSVYPPGLGGRAHQRSFRFSSSVPTGLGGFLSLDLRVSSAISI